ncbi:MAG: FAD-dependent monooxygenase [Alphaproteobacteria bacterium]|nr:FAD-dependent monooxygenase [Alphaproteobacteria bacterium]
MDSIETPDIVVVGGGIAGGAFSAVMARAGHSVLMLEITERHRDVVRGEWLAPWGVIEAQRLGLYDLYRSHGAHHLKRHISYDEDVDRTEAEAKAMAFEAIIPGGLGPLTIGHPRLCGILDDAAVAAGARFVRGVRKTHVTPGDRPTVTFEHQGVAHEIKPRLVVAADGRHGKTVQQMGFKVESDPPHHWFSGMLVENAHGWPDDLQSIGVAGDMNYFIFPQGGGKARLYQGVALDQKARFMGDDAPQRFVEGFRLACLPDDGAAIVDSKPASQCFVYPNNDTWIDVPVGPGVIAIGDAAGHNDPTIGQGLSVSHRDVRVVSDILNANNDWSPAALAPYAEERRERMRRLRLSGRLPAVRDCEFDAAGRARRERLRGKFMVDPLITGLALATLIGPENVPAEIFDARALEAALG